MKHHLLVYSLILFTLFAYTGCTQKTSIEKRIPTEEPINILTDENDTPITSEVSTHSITNNKISYHFKSIQGDVIEIIEGRTGFTFPQYKDKIVILEIFGKDCAFCMEELPMISRLRNKYGNDLKVISIQAEEPMTRSEYLTLKEKFNMTYPIIEQEVAIELLYSLRDTFSWTKILPYVQIIKDDVTQFQFQGETSEKDLNSAMQELAGY